MIKFVYCLILFFPLIWITGLQVLFYHIFSLLLFLLLILKTFKNDDNIKLNFNTKILLLFLLTYSLSLVNVYLSNSVGILRIFGSGYNLFSLVCGLFLIIIVNKNYNDKDFLFFLKYIWITPTLAGIISIVSIVFFSKYTNTEFQSILGSILDLSLVPKIILDSSLIKLTSQDWLFGDASIRTSVFGVYPNATAGLMLLLLPLNFFVYEKSSKKRYLFGFVFAFITVVLTASRISIFAVIFSYFIGYLFFNKKIAQKTIVLISIVFFILFNITNFNSFLNVREGSTNTRLAVIEEGVYLVNESPWLGLGYKPKYEELSVSIGSHSSYIGSYIKTGYIGFFLFCLWQIHLLLKLLRKSSDYNSLSINKAFFVTLLSVSIWMIAEDIDAPQIVWFTYFVILGHAYKLILYK